MQCAYRPLIATLFGTLLSGLGSLAHAQMVPMPTNIVTGHAVVRSNTSTLTGDLATASIGLHIPRQAASSGDGLALKEPPSTNLWPHWEGRIGVVLDRPADPMSNSFVLAQPAYNGLKVYSMHLLSDYYFAGGFRATAGLVRGLSNMPWWPSEQQGATGLNLSMQRLDVLSPPGYEGASEDHNRTSPYLGAGYSTRLSGLRSDSAWRFNADLGLITINSNNIDRISRALQGDAGVETIIRELRLRPVVKVSVNYAF
jgi:hypothetical protein